MQRVNQTTKRPPDPPIVVGVRLKKTTAEVIRSSVESQGGGKRGEITEISKRSVKNAVEILTNAEPELNSMVVLTYPETYPTDGRIVKEHHRRMLHAIERKFGDFDYFTAVEYQKRGAPHLHIGLSINLSDHGDVVDVKRQTFTRRKPTYQTVKRWADWIFHAWVGIISEDEPKRHGVKLDWYGITDNDYQMMRKAYFEHHSGVSWEVMRDTDGAKKYFVKELTGLKSYQKHIPEQFEHPGRHFLYSRSMKFDENEAIEFIVSDAEIRELLSDWEYLPKPNQPLFKHLWNVAGLLASKLIEAGARPIKGGMETIRKYADARMAEFADKTSKQWREAAQYADFRQAWESVKHWERQKRIFEHEDYWDFIYSTGGV